METFDVLVAVDLGLVWARGRFMTFTFLFVFIVSSTIILYNYTSHMELKYLSHKKGNANETQQSNHRHAQRTSIPFLIAGGGAGAGTAGGSAGGGAG